MCITEKEKQRKENQDWQDLVLTRLVKGSVIDKVTLEQNPEDVRIGAPWRDYLEALGKNPDLQIDKEDGPGPWEKLPLNTVNC